MSKEVKSKSKTKPDCPFSFPKLDLTRDESVQVLPDESIVTVASDGLPIDRNVERSKEEEDKTIEWFVTMIALISYVHFSSENSIKKARTEEFQESIAVTLFTNLHAFCGDELLHVLACLGTYQHRRPLAYWYRLYTVIGESARLPLFYLYIQPELNRQMQPLYSNVKWQQNFMALLLGYMLLNSFSRLYSELINPKFLLSNQQREIFFKWRRNVSDKPTPDSSPATTPSPKNFDVYDTSAENYMPGTVLSKISETTEGSAVTPHASAMREHYIRYGLSWSIESTPSSSNQSTPKHSTPSPGS